MAGDMHRSKSSTARPSRANVDSAAGGRRGRLPPPSRLQVPVGEDRLHRLQGRAAADAVRPRARQDPAAAPLGHERQVAAQAAGRAQARPRAGAHPVRHGLGAATRRNPIMIEVILKEPVDHLGSRGDVVKVADGFARNYLLPRKLALRSRPATSVRSTPRRSAPPSARREDRSVAEAIASRSAPDGVRRRPPRRREGRALRLGHVGRRRRGPRPPRLRGRQAQDPAARADQGARRVLGPGAAAPRRHRAGQGARRQGRLAGAASRGRLAASSARQRSRGVALVGRRDTSSCFVGDSRLRRRQVSVDGRFRSVRAHLSRPGSPGRSRRSRRRRSRRSHAAAQPRRRALGARRHPAPQRHVQPRRGGHRRRRLLPRRAPPHLRARWSSSTSAATPST